jgi:hypothetical protein
VPLGQGYVKRPTPTQHHDGDHHQQNEDGNKREKERGLKKGAFCNKKSCFSRIRSSSGILQAPDALLSPAFDAQAAKVSLAKCSPFGYQYAGL